MKMYESRSDAAQSKCPQKESRQLYQVYEGSSRRRGDGLIGLARLWISVENYRP